jgi:hypothetical protein
MNVIRLIVALVLLAGVAAVIYWYGSGRVHRRSAEGTSRAEARRRRKAERKTQPFGAGLPATLLSPTVEPADDTSSDRPEGSS